MQEEDQIQDLLSQMDLDWSSGGGSGVTHTGDSGSTEVLVYSDIVGDEDEDDVYDYEQPLYGGEEMFGGFDNMVDDIVADQELPFNLNALGGMRDYYDTTLGQHVDYDPDQELSANITRQGSIGSLFHRPMSANGREDDPTYRDITGLLGDLSGSNADYGDGYDFTPTEGNPDMDSYWDQQFGSGNGASIPLITVIEDEPSWTEVWNAIEEISAENQTVDFYQPNEDGLNPIQWATEYLNDPQTLGMMTPEQFEGVKEDFQSLKNIFAYGSDRGVGQRVFKDGSKGFASQKDMKAFRSALMTFEQKLAQRAHGRFLLNEKPAEPKKNWKLI